MIMTKKLSTKSLTGVLSVDSKIWWMGDSNSLRLSPIGDVLAYSKPRNKVLKVVAYRRQASILNETIVPELTLMELAFCRKVRTSHMLLRTLNKEISIVDHPLFGKGKLRPSKVKELSSIMMSNTSAKHKTKIEGLHKVDVEIVSDLFGCKSKETYLFGLNEIGTYNMSKKKVVYPNKTSSVYLNDTATGCIYYLQDNKYMNETRLFA